MRDHRLTALITLLTLGACAQTPTRPSQAAPVPVYDSTQIALERYSVMRRIGVEGSHSAFGIKGHADLQSAQRAVVTAAAEVGADGVINLTCFDKTDALFNPTGYYCYGNAIALRADAKK